MTEECSHETPANPECLPWYRGSFVFVLLTFQMFSVGWLSYGLIAAVLAVVNIENDDWYKHRWPWFIVALFSVPFAMKLLFLKFIVNIDIVTIIY
jgi:hypothetical protein